jgi:hypothetical protein
MSIKATVEKVKSFLVEETAAAVGAKAQETLQLLQNLEGECDQLEQDLEDSVLDGEAYAKAEAALTKNKTERKRLETLLPLLEKKREELMLKDAQAAIDKRGAELERLYAIGEELHRTAYMEAARIVAAVAAFDKFVLDAESGMIESARRANLNSPDPSRGGFKPLNDKIMLPNPLNGSYSLWKPGNNPLHSGPIIGAVAFAPLTERLLAAVNAGKELVKIVQETPLPTEALKETPSKPAPDISHADAEPGSSSSHVSSIDSENGKITNIRYREQEANPWGAEQMAELARNGGAG